MEFVLLDWVDPSLKREIASNLHMIDMLDMMIQIELTGSQPLREGLENVDVGRIPLTMTFAAVTLPSVAFHSDALAVDVDRIGSRLRSFVCARAAARKTIQHATCH